MIHVTDDTFEQVVLRGEMPVVVDFWAPWCGPCHAVEPIFQQLAAEHAGRILFVKLNIDENSVHTRYDVLSIPTAILFEGGEPRETVIGARPKPHFERAWAHWLAAPARPLPGEGVRREVLPAAERRGPPPEQ